MVDGGLGGGGGEGDGVSLTKWNSKSLSSDFPFSHICEFNLILFLYLISGIFGYHSKI
jgi:hypothetical protein